MKYKTTQKAVKSGYNHVIRIGYCNLQSLLNYRAPVAYTARREGWGADIYDVGNGIAIATGYAPFGDVKPDYAVVRAYEDKAREILNNACDYNDICKALDVLIMEFIGTVVYGEEV